MKITTYINKVHIYCSLYETPSIRVYKLFLKELRRSPKEKVQKGQYLLAMDLNRYKWYQCQTWGNVLARRLFFEGGWTQGGVPIRTLAPKGVGFGGILHRLERERIVSEDARPCKGWIVMSHIGWGGERNTLYKSVKTFH